MKKLVLTLLLAATAGLAAQAQCPTTAANVVRVGPGTVAKTGTDITTNTTWTRGNIYLLDGIVYVNEGATLTIESGTIIKGSFANQGALVIRRGGRINAAGTAAQPIVFTSEKAPGERRAGDWGGIIICGKAPINRAGDPQIEGGTLANYGGTDPADNSGVLQYVRIEYPGIPFLPGNEINGLTLGGVGYGTTIDHIQVTASGDDSFEWFGGTVNAKYLIALAGTDDDFDTDFGYSGRVQFGFALRDPAVGDNATNGVSNGFESDNDGDNSARTPQTSAVFSNITILKPASTADHPAFANSSGALVRQNSAQSIFNSVFAGRRAGLEINGGTAGTTQANATSGALAFQNNVLAGYAPRRVARLGGFGTTTPIFRINDFVGLSAINDTTRTLAELGLNGGNLDFNGDCSASRSCTPNLNLPTASVLSSGAAFTSAKLTGAGNGGANGTFDVVTHRGAFGATNWAAGWSNFNPQLTCYNVAGQTLANRTVINAPLEALTVSPNPTEGAAALGFNVKRATTATVRVLDVLGREVATVLKAGKLAAGPQRLALPATLAPGVYIATVATAEAVQSVRFVVTK